MNTILKRLNTPDTAGVNITINSILYISTHVPQHLFFAVAKTEGSEVKGISEANRPRKSGITKIHRLPPKLAN